MNLLPYYNLKLDITHFRPGFENTILFQKINLKTEVKLFKAKEVFTQNLMHFLLKGDYFPLTKTMNRYEDHCIHFGRLVRINKKKNV